MNHILNLAVQVFLKTIKALSAKEVVVYNLDDDKDKDKDKDENNHNMEIDDDEGDWSEDLVLNPKVLEEEADYLNIGDNFQGTLKKLRDIAKVHDVAHKITFALLSN